MAASEDPQKRLQALSEEYQRLQQSLSDLVSARQKLSSQQQENQSVKNEFGKLDAESQIYKLLGPVLLKQDHAEAGMAVDGRLEYIGKELQRVEDQIKEVQDNSEGKKFEIYQLQSQLSSEEGAAA